MKTKAQQIIDELNKWNAKQAMRQQVVTPEDLRVVNKILIKYKGQFKEVQTLNATFFLN